MGISARNLLTQDEEAKLVATIGAAEKRTSGEIKIHIEDHAPRAPIRRAEELFETLDLTQTQARNGVLIYLAVKDKAYAIIGDAGIDEKVPHDFWDDIRDGMGERFREGHFFDGIRYAVEETGRQLAEFFPWRSDDVNELPNEISFGDKQES